MLDGAKQSLLHSIQQHLQSQQSYLMFTWNLPCKSSRVRIKNMSYSCCVYNCKTLKGTMCHMLPSDETRRTEWLKAVKRDDLINIDFDKIKHIHRVCTLHFSQNQKFIDYKNRSNLKCTAVPDIRLPVGKCPPVSNVYQIKDGKVVLSKKKMDNTPMFRRVEAGRNLENYLKKRMDMMQNGEEFLWNSPKVVLNTRRISSLKEKILSAQSIPQSDDNKTEPDADTLKNDGVVESSNPYDRKKVQKRLLLRNKPGSSNNSTVNESSDEDTEDISKIKEYITNMLKSKLPEKPNSTTTNERRDYIVLSNTNRKRKAEAIHLPGNVSKINEVIINRNRYEKPHTNVKKRYVINRDVNEHIKSNLEIADKVTDGSYLIIVESGDENENDDDDDGKEYNIKTKMNDLEADQIYENTVNVESMDDNGETNEENYDSTENVDSDYADTSNLCKNDELNQSIINNKIVLKTESYKIVQDKKDNAISLVARRGKVDGNNAEDDDSEDNNSHIDRHNFTKMHTNRITRKRNGVQFLGEEARIYYDIAVRLNRKVKNLKCVVRNLQEKLSDSLYNKDSN